MKRFDYILMLPVFLGATFLGMKDVKGELVYENELNAPANVDAASTTVPAPTTVIPTVTAAVPAPEATPPRVEERKQITKSEMMRRQRLREELKNEDLLTQKLEELRLRDEVKRTQQILGSGVEKSPSSAPETMTEERVGSAVQDTATTATPPNASVNGAAAQTASAAAVSGAAVAGTSVARAEPLKEEDGELAGRVLIMPRFGLGSVTGTIYDVSSKFAAGIGVAVDATNYISFEAGYTYAKYSIAPGNSLSYPSGFNSSQLQSVSMNDNIIDLGMKASLLGQASRVRPFIGAGLGYRRGYVNYDDATLNYMKRYSPYSVQDVQISGFLGYVETGLEFRLTKTMSLTGMFRYYDVLSSSQTNPLNPYGFIGQNGYNSGYAYPGYGYNQDTKTAASTALAKNNFYVLAVGVGISF